MHTMQLHDHLHCTSYRVAHNNACYIHMFTGWIFRGSAYCQLIRDANKIKNVQLCVKHLHDSFNDVVNTD